MSILTAADNADASRRNAKPNISNYIAYKSTTLNSRIYETQNKADVIVSQNKHLYLFYYHQQCFSV